ncbi:MAG: prolyl oligopeptidase family serine peptidase [Prevotellaceae bacterium]|jgi:prolyl oligopeptidase|nr:prolyl oligopeptidase family serine peptidase [Prevotellaceae bacterium]
MKKLSLFLIPMLAVGCSQQPKSIPVSYPETQKIEHSDLYFGTEIADPYRWLEDDRSDETAAWVKLQNEVTFGYLEKIPFRNEIKSKLTEMWNYPRQGVPFKAGEKYFMWKNDGLQNQSVLYIMDGLDGKPREFINPNTISQQGTTAVGSLSISNDNKYVAYTTSVGGSDWKEIHIKDIDGNDLPDMIQWVKFSGISWDDNGFYYSCYDEPKGSVLSSKNESNRIYYHKLDTKQKDDKLIYEDLKNPLRYNTAGITKDGRYLILSVSEGTGGNSLAVRDMIKFGSKFRTIVEKLDKDYDVIENFDDELYVLTNDNAPRYRLMKINPSATKLEWEVVIPESETDVLQSVTVIGDKLVANYLHNAYSVLNIFDRNGNLETEIKLPELGTIGGISGEKGDNEMFYAFSSFSRPTEIYRMEDINQFDPKLYLATELNFKLSKYVTEQVWYTSKDGTRVPMFIVYKEGLKKNGKNPTLLYGYGGFNSSITPGFSISNLFFLEQGGIYAAPNIRGGGEFGEAWHKAGTKLQKQNVFDDFIVAAEYLIEQKYTSPKKLAIRGGSNGGLLVGTCVNQRPELYKVALPAVVVMDMLRFHKFTVGWGWVGDYGSSDNEEQFHYLLGYSPLHNIQQGVCYPATLITTADHDDRVVPAHSFKYAATMQEAQDCENPILIRIETMAGHGTGKPMSKSIEEATDMWSFVLYNLGMKYKK